MSIWEDVLDGQWGCAVLPGTAHTRLYQERTGAAATIPADADGDPVGTIHDLISGITITMPSDDARPLYRVLGGVHWLECRPEASPAFSRIQAVLPAFTGTTLFGIAAVRPSNFGRLLSVGIDSAFAHDWDSTERAELLGHNAIDGVGMYRNGIDTRHGLGAINTDIVAETLSGPTASESVRNGGTPETETYASVGDFNVNAIGFMSAAGQPREWSSGRLYAALVVGAVPSALERAALLAAAQGSIAGNTDGDAAGATLTAGAGLVAGEASGQWSPTVAGQVFAAAGAVVAGTASGERSPTVAGPMLTVSASLAAGEASGQRSPTVAGQVLTAAAVLVAGTAGGAGQPTADSKREAVLKALVGALGSAKPADATLLRNAVLPERIPAAGIMILRDGDPGEPEFLFSPPRYFYEHRAEIDVLVDGPTPAARDAAFDLILQTIAQALAANRTLGGLVDYALGEAPAPLDLPVEGAEGLKAASIAVILPYDTGDPLA